MRTIKFRGKNYDGMWMYGYLMPIKSPIHLDCKYGISVSPSALKSVDRILYEVETNTIGQYTGLKDKNGKEIYEGDIVRMKEIGGYGSEYIGVVRYYEKDCRFGIDFTATDKFRKRGLFTEGEIQENDGHCTITYTHEYEILGNVHDNPELLTNKE